MRKEARLLKDKAVDAVMLAVESFNRPVDRGRTDSVLRDLSHAFEMLMKAVIVERGGRIRERRATQTIGFDACVRKGLSDEKVKFLGEEQALTIQMLNALRDAAEHYLVELSEQQLYVQAQAALTLFADILEDGWSAGSSSRSAESGFAATCRGTGLRIGMASGTFLMTHD